MTDVVRLAGLILAPHCNYFHIAHGIRHQARELLVGFFRLSRGPGHRGERRFLQHPATPAALELLRLWMLASGADQKPLARWQQLLEQASAPPLPPAGGQPKARRPRRRRSRGGRRPPAGQN